ncbi:MAG: hypothetical protein E6Z79_01070 [Haemophilus parainfluenzae]|nr:hypothetical protein [Haemophilus parainfluenzae]
MDFDSSSTVMEFKNNFPIPDVIHWDGECFKPKDSVSEDTAYMYTNLLAGFIAGLEASGRMTDFEVKPLCRNQ